MSQALYIQENESLVRSVARVCLLLLLASSLFACSSSGSDDPNAPTPTATGTATVDRFAVTVLQGRSVVVRVDVDGLPANASVAGFSSDLPETVADIDITTQSCPSGVGTVSCQDWTISPGANSIPGDYAVTIGPVGATVSIVPTSGHFSMRVLAEPPNVTRPAISVESSRGRGVPAGTGPGGRNFTNLNHVLFITDDGRLFGYGYNSAGQVLQRYVTTSTVNGVHDEVQPYSIPKPVPVGPGAWRWSAVATAVGLPDDTSDQGRSFALLQDNGIQEDSGTVWAWGRDQQGFIVAPPVQITSLSKIIAISALDPGSWLALDNAGQVYGGGDSRPVFVTGTSSPLSGVKAIAGATGGPFREIQSVAAFYGNGYVLKADDTPAKIYKNKIDFATPGTLYAGDMVGGWNNTTAIAAGSDHFLALRSDGVVLAAGKNGSGQLGNGSTTDAPFIRECTPNSGCDDLRFINNPVQVSGLSSVKAIVAKADRSFALLTDGTVWTWGGGILTPVQVQNLDNVRTIGPGYAIRNDCSGSGGTLWAILFPSGAPPTAERVPGVGDNSGCTVPSFELSLGTEILNLMPAADQQQVSVNLARTGYNGAVDLEVIDCPSNVQCIPSPDPIPGNVNSSTLTISTNNATPGNYVVTVRGSGGGVTREVLLELHILGL